VKSFREKADLGRVREKRELDNKKEIDLEGEKKRMQSASSK